MKYAVIATLGIVSLFFISYEVLHEEANHTSKHIASTKETPPLLFVGDIMLGRHVETLAKRYGDELFMFASTTEYLKQHITIANLEGPIPEDHVQTPVNGFSFSFASSTSRILKLGGIQAVSLANNHMFDKGRNGYEETKQALEQGGVAHFGGYSPTTDDYFETKLGTTTVVVYGITMIATGWDESQALNVTEKLRKEHPQAHLIAFLHWGDEYVTQNIYQRAFTHKLIDRGVDTIIGAHPHVVQGVELYKEKPIFYSLGNFIFDQYWRSDLEDGYMVRISSLDSGIRYELVPVRSSRSMPAIATESARLRVLDDIAKQSDVVLVDSIKKGYIDITTK
jgi:poly-gamma-glutamate synthesis protein (capsule biosynthesis protein)